MNTSALTKRTASCLCGALRVETAGEPWRTMICSCADCRKKSGSAFAHSTYWPRAAVAITGKAHSWTRDGQGTRSLTYHFCPTCGVSLYWEADFAPDHIGIGGGNFDDPNFAPPFNAYWTEGRPDWALDLTTLPSKARQEK